MVKECLHCKAPFETVTSKKYCSTYCKQHYVWPDGRSRSQRAGDRVSEWRRRTKLRAIEYKGGKCIVCGYNRCAACLDFHHLDPNEKDFGIGETGSTRSWERVKSELDKCVLLCRNCHGEVHAGVTILEVNDGSSSSKS